MFRLAHLSDVHLGPLPDVSYGDLASKRVFGYVNWQRNRRHVIHGGVLGHVVDDMKANAPNHIAVTGDLVNLALDGEIELARLWLETLGSPKDVSVVPGNHDAYVPGSLDKVCRSWGAWMSGDDSAGPTSRHSFPYMRVRGPVALIGVSTARATAPFMANGFFREDQSHRLGRLLHRAGRLGLFRAIMIHHPPVRNAVSQHKRLFGISVFQGVVAKHGAELVLHGHSHDPSLFWIDGKDGPIPIVGVAAGGQSPGGHQAPAQYNLLEIAGGAGNWQVKLTRRGLTGTATPVTELSSTNLTAETSRGAAATAAG